MAKTRLNVTGLNYFIKALISGLMAFFRLRCWLVALPAKDSPYSTFTGNTFESIGLDPSLVKGKQILSRIV